MIQMITREEWKKSSRAERYQYLRKLGVSTTESRRVRDFGYNKLVLFEPTLKVGPKRPIPKKKKQITTPKLSLGERKGMWALISRYWHKKGPVKQRIYNSMTPYEREKAEQWQKEAIAMNKELWNQMSREQKMLLRWSEAETYSHGYGIVYRHYILGQSWKKAMQGVIMDPTVEPDEY